MTPKADGKEFARRAMQLAQLGLDAQYVARSEARKISRQWLERFCPRVKQKTGKWIFQGYRWHAYSFGHETALHGLRAFDNYMSKPIEPFCVYFERDDHLFDCTSAQWADLRPFDDDIYVFPHGMSWTFVTTHEMSLDLGPYFAEPVPLDEQTVTDAGRHTVRRTRK